MPVQLPSLPRIRISSKSAPRISDSCGLEGITRFEAFQQKLEKFTSHGGALSRNAKLRKEEIRQLLTNGAEFSKIICSRRDARLLIMLYRESLELYEYRPITKSFFNLLEIHNNPISGSLLRDFIKFYFEEYDRIEPQNLVTVNIIKYLEEFATRPRVPKDIELYSSNTGILFSKNAPSLFVSQAKAVVSNSSSLLAFAKSLKIPHSDDARFFELVTQFYYLETLKSLPIGVEHSVMSEFKATPVKESIGPGGLMLGQSAVKILIERCISEGQPMPDNWRDFVLSICTDPRVPKGNKNFAKWWAPIDGKLIDAMKKWLSKWDLELFLKLLKSYAKQSGKSDMQRMLPARKIFLEGLLKENLVVNSRLMLSHDAASTLKRSVHKDNLPEFALLDSGERCMIYLDLGTGILIEGSHNFAARVFTDFNITGLSDYTRSKFSPFQITNHKVFETIVHYSSKKPLWQHNLIQALKSKPIGLKFNPENMLTRADWQIYKQEWGMN